MSLADERERIRKEDRMSEESVMRSLNTDAGLGRYIAGKGETKKTVSRGREVGEGGDEEGAMGWSDRMNWMERGSSTRKELAIGPSHRRLVSCDARS